MYYHYNVIQRTEATVHQHYKLAKKLKDSKDKEQQLPVCPLPQLPQLTPLFRPLTKIVGSVPVMQVVISTLKR